MIRADKDTPHRTQIAQALFIKQVIKRSMSGKRTLYHTLSSLCVNKK